MLIFFYQVLTLDLISRVFNIDFVTRLEKELSLMYDAVNQKSMIINIHDNKQIHIFFINF